MNIGDRLDTLIKENIQREERNKINRDSISKGIQLARNNMDLAKRLDEKYGTRFYELFSTSEEELLTIPGKAKEVHNMIEEELNKVLNIIEKA